MFNPTVKSYILENVVQLLKVSHLFQGKYEIPEDAVTYFSLNMHGKSAKVCPKLFLLSM